MELRSRQSSWRHSQESCLRCTVQGLRAPRVKSRASVLYQERQNRPRGDPQRAGAETHEPSGTGQGKATRTKEENAPARVDVFWSPAGTWFSPEIVTRLLRLTASCTGEGDVGFCDGWRLKARLAGR